MTPLKYYLLRAAYDWAVENGFTPHVIVDANAAGVTVPVRHVENGKIVLNVHPQAVRDFHFDAEAMSFNARFSGVSQGVHLPLVAVLAVYARENGQGVSFPAKDDKAEGGEPSGPDETPPAGPGPRKGPVLKVVK
jgi:stringent starvation protein B